MGTNPGAPTNDKNQYTISLQWRHNERDGVSTHQPHECLLNRSFRRRSKKTSKLCVTGLCAGNSPWPVNSPSKGPLTRKKFPFDDVIIYFTSYLGLYSQSGKTSYCQISSSLETARFDVIMIELPLKLDRHLDSSAADVPVKFQSDMMTLRNKLQWNLNQNIKVFIHENASEYIVCKKAAILSSEGWVKMANAKH